MDDTFFAYYQIFDESLAHLSPGKVIVAHMVKEVFSRGLFEMNMSEGEADYKREWTRTSREYREAYLINGSRVKCTPLHAALRLRRGIKSSPGLMRFVHRLKSRPGNGRRKRNRRLYTR
jgi:CelD/BcsL family acetyltransferase involved in cellulose biosynthesis